MAGQATASTIQYLESALEGLLLVVSVSFITTGDIVRAILLGAAGAVGGLIVRFIWKKVSKK